jgi:hypothetical protein
MISVGMFTKQYPVPKLLERVGGIQSGGSVTAGSTLWKSVQQGKLHAVSLTQFFQTDAVTARTYLIKEVGANVQKAEPLARQESLIPMFSQELYAPVLGLIESFHEPSATLYLREPAREQLFCSQMSGQFHDHGHSISIASSGLIVQGAYGDGIPCFGEFQWLENINLSSQPDASTLIVGLKKSPCHEALNQLAGVKAVIAASMSLSDISAMRAHGVTVIVTEGVLSDGIGQLTMSRKLIEVLDQCCGFEVSLFPETRVYAGAVRPVIFCSHREASSIPIDPLSYRCIRAPHLGVYGTLGAHDDRTAILFAEDGRQLSMKMQNLAPVFASISL